MLPGAIEIFCRVVGLFLLVAAGLQVAGGSVLQRPYIRTSQVVGQGHLDALVISGEWAKVYAELNLAVPGCSSLTVPEKPPYPQSHAILNNFQSNPKPTPSNYDKTDYQDFQQPRLEASSIIHELKDEQWHDVGLRKMWKRRSTFGLPPMAISSTSLLRTQPELGSDNSTSFMFRLAALFRSLRSTKFISTPNQLYFSIDAQREPRTTVERIMADYSNFNSLANAGNHPGKRGTAKYGVRKTTVATNSRPRPRRKARRRVHTEH